VSVIALGWEVGFSEVMGDLQVALSPIGYTGLRGGRLKNQVKNLGGIRLLGENGSAVYYPVTLLLLLLKVIRRQLMKYLFSTMQRARASILGRPAN
jgi:hypothetical protein